MTVCLQSCRTCHPDLAGAHDVETANILTLLDGIRADVVAQRFDVLTCTGTAAFVPLVSDYFMDRLPKKVRR